MTESLIFKLASASAEMPDLNRMAPFGSSVDRVEPLFPDAFADEELAGLMVAEVTVASRQVLDQFLHNLATATNVEFAHLPGRRDLLG
ncbi:MAG TPA: hypothetical protein VE913_14445 [Longimicrobium sp.]|nr:hypothetical protein [Longimicrobium sp.]